MAKKKIDKVIRSKYKDLHEIKHLGLKEALLILSRTIIRKSEIRKDITNITLQEIPVEIEKTSDKLKNLRESKSNLETNYNPLSSDFDAVNKIISHYQKKLNNYLEELKLKQLNLEFENCQNQPLELQKLLSKVDNELVPYKLFIVMKFKDPSGEIYSKSFPLGSYPGKLIYLKEKIEQILNKN
ncbi:MAG: hypothetical protein V1824_04125 [archaeon]